MEIRVEEMDQTTNMFICNICLKDYKNLQSILQSRGVCELCRSLGLCSDIPSGDLQKKEEKKAHGSWHAPKLGIECPFCGEWDDFWPQVENMDSPPPLEPFRSYQEDELKGLELDCLACKKTFQLELVEY